MVGEHHTTIRRIRFLSIALLLGARVASADPGPGPGEPFGGDDAGCVPLSTDVRRCSDSGASAYSKLEAAINKCHVGLASARYAEVVLGQTSSYDEEACEASAFVTFDNAVASLEVSDECASSTVPALLPDEATLLDMTLDLRGAEVWCDATTGVELDPAGDEEGIVPATSEALACTKRVNISLAKLAKAIVRCHQKGASYGLALRDPPYDAEACENKARGKFAVSASRLIAGGTCPPCLDSAALVTLCEDTIDRVDARNATLYPCPDPVLHVGTPAFDRPTLMALGVRLPITGDANRTATVAVRYRETGELAWIDAMPLMRVLPETVPPGSPNAIVEHFAGSLLDLRPDTEYDIELHAVDADGSVDETLNLSATTRAVPTDPASPDPVAVSDEASLQAALADAEAGDVITLADGVYDGNFVLSASGTATNPIVIRGTSRDGTILDGGGCTGCNILEVYGSFVHVENLTLRDASRALRFQSEDAEANVVRRVHIEDVILGIAGRGPQYDFYFCDNLVEGRLAWPNIYTDDGGDHSNDDGINVQGHGHVVCHNEIVGFGDAIKTEFDGARAIDFYGNEVLSAYDNAVELDGGEGNVRAWRNRFTNTFATLSVQPIYGGPAYMLRNVAVNIADEQMKFHGLGGNDGPSGVLAYNNTFLSSDLALHVYTTAASRNFEIRNNLFVGPETLTGTRTADWTGLVENFVFESDGFFPDGGFRFRLTPDELTSYANFAALQAGGLETTGTLLTEPIFVNGLVGPASYTTTLAAQDMTLHATSNAVDAGAVLPGVTNGYVGAAPDIGALERGCPLPIFGIRPNGTDETNEPTGCE